MREGLLHLSVSDLVKRSPASLARHGAWTLQPASQPCQITSEQLQAVSVVNWRGEETGAARAFYLGLSASSQETDTHGVWTPVARAWMFCSIWMPDIWLFMNSFIGIHIRFFVCLLLHSLSSFFWQTTDLIFFTDIISKINSTKAIPSHSLLTHVSLKTMHSILIPLKKKS